MTSKAVIKVGEGVREVYLPLSPVPAARPRVSRWGTYYPKKYATWKKEAGDMLAALDDPCSPWEGAVFALVTCGAPRPKKPANPYPVPDVDNYAKAVLDAVKKCGYLIVDDKQVQILTVSKRYVTGDEVPYTYVLLTKTLEQLTDHMYFFEPTHGGEDVYDLPERFRTPLHMLSDEDVAAG